ncbi:MAG: Mrp/NBP35 family ATP-binding protein [Neisseriaceae bacterium]|nr:Mrp/NBP35 family ATP-binding protein [Neisseriaceae bacterium]
MFGKNIDKLISDVVIDEKNPVTLGQLKVKTQTNAQKIEIFLPFPIGFASDLSAHIRDKLSSCGIEKEVVLCEKIISHKVRAGLNTLPEIKNTLAIASGKGGVGKSTVTANLAIALSKAGARVGILDADLYGPSQPTMFSLQNEKLFQENKMFVPLESNGIQIMSIGLMVEDNQALVWRGPLITQALQQMFFQTAWNELDYLLIDLPPGTGDIQLTLAQKIPLTAALIVSTPQDIALIDAKKAINMFEKVSIPVLGIVENMSIYICPCCGRREEIFGSGGGEHLSQQYQLPLLGKLPLSANIRQAMDSGLPFDLFNDVSLSSDYNDMAFRVSVEIAKLGKDYSHSFPKMVVANK